MCHPKMRGFVILFASADKNVGLSIVVYPGERRVSTNQKGISGRTMHLPVKRIGKRLHKNERAYMATFDTQSFSNDNSFAV